MKSTRLILLALYLSNFLYGCASVADIRNSPPRFQGQFQGNYSKAARCVADKMQEDDRWSIKRLQYNVRVYPDIETSEIQAYASSAYTGAIYAFILTLKQVNKESIEGVLKGSEFSSGIAWKYLNACTNK